MHAHLLAKATQYYPRAKKSTLKNTLLMVALLLDQKTVNLWRLKGSVGRLLGNVNTAPDSHYQRLKRWLLEAKKQDRLWVAILRASTELLTGKSRYLILDGTSWQAHGVTYHFLSLSLLYQGVSVPIYWLELDRLGQSSQWQRRLLLRGACRVFRLAGKILLGDREYIGLEWFRELRQAHLDLVIRLRCRDYRAEIAQGGQPVAVLEARAKARPGRVVSQCFSLQGLSYRFVILVVQTRTGKGEYLRLITSLAASQAVEAYKLRYGIETMFKHLKSNGFQLESLGVERPYKVQMMMAVVVLAYTLAVVEGLADFARKVKRKKHGRWAVSVFRWGLDKWQVHLLDLASFVSRIELVVTRCKPVYYKWSPQNVP